MYPHSDFWPSHPAESITSLSGGSQMQSEATRRRNRLCKSAAVTLRRGHAGFMGRLAVCAFAAGTLLVLPLAARATSIVYSGPLNETISFAMPGVNTTTNSSLVVDLGAVGAATFLANSTDRRTTICTFSVAGLCLSQEYQDTVSAYVGLTLTGANVEGNAAGIFPLPAGTAIGAGDSFQPGVGFSIVDGVTNVYVTDTLFGFIPIGSLDSSSTIGPWPDNGTPYFLGLEIPTGGGTADYGWLEMEGGGAAVTILGYAYDGIPGAAIDAGETSNDVLLSVPEPSSLALMWAGLGAVGFVVSRRRARFRTN
jgi:hypothetical protein